MELINLDKRWADMIDEANQHLGSSQIGPALVLANQVLAEALQERKRAKTDGERRSATRTAAAANDLLQRIKSGG